jgi:hypothetical protein
MPTPLHPNLARIAASYDEILEMHRLGSISAREAHGRMSALVGRDDTGLVWFINPESGKWSYRNLRGVLIESEPPHYGIASHCPKDLGAGSQVNLDSRLTFYMVDPDLLRIGKVKPGIIRTIIISFLKLFNR